MFDMKLEYLEPKVVRKTLDLSPGARVRIKKTTTCGMLTGATTEDSLGQVLYGVYHAFGVSYYTADDLESAPPEESSTRRLQLGDRIGHKHGTALGKIIATEYEDGWCWVEWETPGGMRTTERFGDLFLVEQIDQIQPTRAPVFCVGARVYFRDFSSVGEKIPLGVITAVDESLFHAGQGAFVVTWDNGVYSKHEADELGSVFKLRESLADPTPR